MHRKLRHIVTQNKWFHAKQFTKMGRNFCEALDIFEKTPLLFEAGEDVELAQKKTVKKVLADADLVQTYLALSTSSSVKAQSNLISQRIVGLKYRIEKIHGGLDCDLTIDEELLKTLFKSARDWKKKQLLYPEEDKVLSVRDINKLRSAARYPEFVKILLKDTPLQDTFFKWIIRDNNGIDQFIEFPATSLRIRSALIDKRVGYFAPDELSIRKIRKYSSDGYEKVICLPFFNGKSIDRISVLDESKKVKLNGNWELTIKEIFDSFSNKRLTPGKIEYFGPTGITNWASYEFGSWDPETASYKRISLDKPTWWDQLPIFQILTDDEIKERYHILFDDGDWISVALSACESLDFDLFRRHGYLEMAIPLPGKRYAIYPLGKYPEYFPVDPREQLGLIPKTVRGKIEYYDENIVNTSRQKAMYPKAIKQETGLIIMEKIRKDLIKSLGGDLIFQYVDENCAQWAETTLNEDKESKPMHLFKMPFVEMKPSHSLINKALKIPRILQPLTMRYLNKKASQHGMTVTEDKRPVQKITTFAKTFHEQYLYQPRYLNYQIENKELKGHIKYGN